MRPSRPEGNRRATVPGHGNPGPSAAGRTEPHAGRALAGLHPPASPRRRGRSLEAEEFSLDAEAAPVPSDPLPGRDHPMAGDDDRDRVLPERLPDRAAPARLSDAARDVAVGAHLAGGHARGGPEPAPALERPEPARQRRRTPSIAEQEGDQLVIMSHHMVAHLRRAPPSAARSFLSAW